MTDPAIDAAQRALDGMPMLGEASATQAALKGLVLDVGAAAAREMAKSVQELHKPVIRTDYTDERWIECESCCGEWPCETAKRVYPSEEL
ncbi:hypothetical protein [Mycobacteroides abscessus]|uniref:hypothetical protein n=1 Tax=Mycobacteroides abscessus TaxID=36809 RepID=UPI000C25B439|nr:hypothetical protein [Mycobacteroides abscessus]